MNVFTKRCSDTSCLKRLEWGVLTEREATACLHHNGDILGGHVVDFGLSCNVAGCRRVAYWGIEGKQPTHCSDHGSAEGGLVCTVGRVRRRGSSGGPSCGVVKAPSFHGMSECYF